MITFKDFTPRDGVPIYLQIVRHVKEGIVSGAVADGDELPSRRVLSALLGVNPNTVQKAYKQLEDDGLIESRIGAASYLSLDECKIASVRAELIEDTARSTVTSMRQMGLTLAEATELLGRLWNDQTHERNI